MSGEHYTMELVIGRKPVNPGNPNGPKEVRVEATVHGVIGPACTTISGWVDKLGTVKEDCNTTEFYQEGTAELHTEN
jgi:hypothetical protein